MRRARVLGLVVSLALVAGACGGDDDDPVDAGDATTTTAAAGQASGSTTTTATGETTAPEDGSDGSTTGETVPGDDAGPLDATVAAPDMTGEDICSLLPAAAVESALGVTDVTASAGTTQTPQCSYAFETAAGQDTDATVAALRTEEDLGGRFGDDAFTFVVDLNTATAQGTVTETPLDIGNQAVLLEGGQLYMAVVQLGGRIVTVLLSVDAGDAAAVTALAGAATVLAP